MFWEITTISHWRPGSGRRWDFKKRDGRSHISLGPRQHAGQTETFYPASRKHSTVIIRRTTMNWVKNVENAAIGGDISWAAEALSRCVTLDFPSKPQLLRDFCFQRGQNLRVLPHLYLKQADGCLEEIVCHNSCYGSDSRGVWWLGEGGGREGVKWEFSRNERSCTLQRRGGVPPPPTQPTGSRPAG